MTTAQRCLSQGPITVVYTPPNITAQGPVSFFKRKNYFMAIFYGGSTWSADVQPLYPSFQTVIILHDLLTFVYNTGHNIGEQIITLQEGSVHGYRRAADSSLCRISWNTTGGTCSLDRDKKGEAKKQSKQINDTKFKLFLRLDIFFISCPGSIPVVTFFIMQTDWKKKKNAHIPVKFNFPRTKSMFSTVCTT